MVIHLLILVVLAAVSIWPYKIYCNYLNARRTGLRLIISPLTPFELPWHLCPALFGSIIKRQRWFRALDQTCSWQDKNSLHQELGSCFIIVSPGFNMLCTSDPTAIEYVYKKMKDFVKPDVMKTLDFFGPNIITVNDEAWVRHRKLTAPCFNERVSTFVWDESLRQANDMLQEWLAKPDAKSNAVVQDSGTVALHVLTAAAFGEQRNFREGVNQLAPNHELSFREALRIVLRSPVTAAIVGKMPLLTKPMIQPVLSTRIQKVQLALREFRSYMLEAIAGQRKETSTYPPPNKHLNLLNALVKASDQVKASNPKSSAYMTDAELTGNMFMFAFAGHETTATTISYSLALLAINPHLQDWLAQELTHVTGTLSPLDYTRTHPRLKRTLAVMYETLRLYGVPPPWRDIALPSNHKTIEPLHILISPSTTSPNLLLQPYPLPIPPNTQISLNIYASHTSPQNFPASPLTWDPRRWILSPASSGAQDDMDEETLVAHQKGFFAWGAGPRVCPGMKFAQVEFTAVLATVLGRWRVVPALREERGGGGNDGASGSRKGKEEEEYENRAKQGIRKVLDGSVASIALSFGEPEELWVRLVER